MPDLFQFMAKLQKLLTVLGNFKLYAGSSSHSRESSPTFVPTPSSYSRDCLLVPITRLFIETRVWAGRSLADLVGTGLFGVNGSLPAFAYHAQRSCDVDSSGWCHW